MRVLRVCAFIASLFLALGFAAPEKAQAGTSVYVGYGGVHVYVGPRYRGRYYGYYGRPYYPRYYYGRAYYNYPYYHRRYKARRYYRRHRHYRRHYRIRHW